MNLVPILANAGVPMIFIAVPRMVPLLIPVILLELYVARRMIRSETLKQKIIGLAAANAFSTFIGWPIAWVVLAVLQMLTGGGGAHGLDSPIGVLLSVTQQAPWLIPYASDLYWMIPVALAVLLVPFFFVSVYVERGMLGHFWRLTDKKTVCRYAWVAHLYSYIFLFFAVVAFGIHSIETK